MSLFWISFHELHWNSCVFGEEPVLVVSCHQWAIFFFAKNNKNADKNTTFALANFSSDKIKRSLLSKANTMLNLYTYLCKTSEFVSKPENMLRCVVV
jgi:hypothetical protein